MNQPIKNLILTKVNTRKCITARTLIVELCGHNFFWTRKDIRLALMELSEAGLVVEVEVVYEGNTNESIFLPKGTVIRQYEK